VLAQGSLNVFQHSYAACYPLPICRPRWIFLAYEFSCLKWVHHLSSYTVCWNSSPMCFLNSLFFSFFEHHPLLPPLFPLMHDPLELDLVSWVSFVIFSSAKFMSSWVLDCIIWGIILGWFWSPDFFILLGSILYECSIRVAGLYGLACTHPNYW